MIKCKKEKWSGRTKGRKGIGKIEKEKNRQEERKNRSLYGKEGRRKDRKRKTEKQILKVQR